MNYYSNHKIDLIYRCQQSGRGMEDAAKRVILCLEVLVIILDISIFNVTPTPSEGGILVALLLNFTFALPMGYLLGLSGAAPLLTSSDYLFQQAVMERRPTFAIFILITMMIMANIVIILSAAPAQPPIQILFLFLDIAIGLVSGAWFGLCAAVKDNTSS